MQHKTLYRLFFGVLFFLLLQTQVSLADNLQIKGKDSFEKQGKDYYSKKTTSWKLEKQLPELKNFSLWFSGQEEKIKQELNDKISEEKKLSVYKNWLDLLFRFSARSDNLKVILEKEPTLKLDDSWQGTVKRTTTIIFKKKKLVIREKGNLKLKLENGLLAGEIVNGERKVELFRKQKDHLAPFVIYHYQKFNWQGEIKGKINIEKGTVIGQLTTLNSTDFSAYLTNNEDEERILKDIPQEKEDLQGHFRMILGVVSDEKINQSFPLYFALFNQTMEKKIKAAKKIEEKIDLLRTSYLFALEIANIYQAGGLPRNLASELNLLPSKPASYIEQKYFDYLEAKQAYLIKQIHQNQSLEKKAFYARQHYELALQTSELVEKKFLSSGIIKLFKLRKKTPGSFIDRTFKDYYIYSTLHFEKEIRTANPAKKKAVIQNYLKFIQQSSKEGQQVLSRGLFKKLNLDPKSKDYPAKKLTKNLQ